MEALNHADFISVFSLCPLEEEEADWLHSLVSNKFVIMVIIGIKNIIVSTTEI